MKMPSKLTFMKLKKLDSGAAGLAMSALAAAPAFGDNLQDRERPLSEPYRVADLVVNQVDCVLDVRLQADLAADNGERLSRRDMRSLLNICETGPVSWQNDHQSFEPLNTVKQLIEFNNLKSNL